MCCQVFLLRFIELCFEVDLVADQRLACLEVHRIDPFMLLSDLDDASC